MGQVRPVTVYRLVTPNTLEVYMAGIAAGKFELAQALMSLSTAGGTAGGNGAENLLSWA